MFKTVFVLEGFTIISHGCQSSFYTSIETMKISSCRHLILKPKTSPEKLCVSAQRLRQPFRIHAEISLSTTRAGERSAWAWASRKWKDQNNDIIDIFSLRANGNCWVFFLGGDLVGWFERFVVGWVFFSGGSRCR